MIFGKTPTPLQGRDHRDIYRLYLAAEAIQEIGTRWGQVWLIHCAEMLGEWTANVERDWYDRGVDNGEDGTS